MFTEYKTTRTRKDPEDLASNKTWQVNARRLYIPLDVKKHGLSVKKWTDQDGKKHHSITWKEKPYCKLLLNSEKKGKTFAMLEVGKTGLAVQVDPSDLKKCYVSIPKGAMEVFPEVNCMLDMKQQGAKITVSRK